MKKLILILFLTGCCTLNQDYVRQDRKDFDTFTPRIEKMIDDTTLYTGAQKEDMRDRLKARNLRITEAEALLEKPSE
jgi:hypothetical protein